MDPSFSALFQPLTTGRGIRRLTLKNRMVMAPLEPSFRQMLLEKLQKFGVKMFPRFLIEEVTATEVIGKNLENHRSSKLKAGTVVVALGTESVDFPGEALRRAGIKVLVIGDAREPGGIAEAVGDGFWAGTTN